MYGEMSVTEGTSFVPFRFSKAHCSFAPSICLRLFMQLQLSGMRRVTKKRPANGTAAITASRTKMVKVRTTELLGDPPNSFSITMLCSQFQAGLELPSANERLVLTHRKGAQA